MNIAIFGGTHGNEPLGIEVIKTLEKNGPHQTNHSFQTFLGNPKAYELQKRFVDCDLNRCFGVNGRSHGYEQKRSQELVQQVAGKFDFVVDIHTTTSNMGMTIILTQTDERTRKVAAFLKKKYPKLILIETIKTDEECCYICNMAPSGFIFEFGAVANNVIRFDHFKIVYNMVLDILNFNETDEIDLSQVEYFKSYEDIKFPDGYYIHPEREGNDFMPVAPGQPLFINFSGEVLNHEGDETIYPMFINEAAYQNERLAMTLSRKKIGF